MTQPTGTASSSASAGEGAPASARKSTAELDALEQQIYDALLPTNSTSWLANNGWGPGPGCAHSSESITVVRAQLVARAVRGG